MDKRYSEFTMLDFQKKFPKEDSCWKHFSKLRWPNGFECPKCKSTKYCLKPSRGLFECYQCKHQTSITAGTIFHKSKIPLHKWFWAIFLIATSKKGTSTVYLQKQLKLGNYKTAWLLTQKVRDAMIQRDSQYTLKGTVQADEIFIGGAQTLEDRRKFGDNKTPFLIMVEEDDNGGPRFVSFEELKTIYDEHILPALEKRIVKGSKIKSDGAGSYVNATKNGYKNERSVYSKEPEKTVAHLKWVNIITSNLKRFLLSTHHGVHHKYRDRYLAEFAYRFNRRYWSQQAFDRLLYACIVSTPISLREITG